MQRIVVVHEDAAVAARWATRLAEAGYPVATAASFEDGKALLASSPPALLIVSVRLGAYNGLHLVIRGRADHPGMAAIVTTTVDDDPALRADAAKHGAVVFSGADDADALIGLVLQALSDHSV